MNSGELNGAGKLFAKRQNEALTDIRKQFFEALDGYAVNYRKGGVVEGKVKKEIKVYEYNDGTLYSGNIKNYNLKIIRSENETGEPLVDDIVNEIGIKSDGTYFSGIGLNTNSSDVENKILKISIKHKLKIV